MRAAAIVSCTLLFVFHSSGCGSGSAQPVAALSMGTLDFGAEGVGLTTSKQVKLNSGGSVPLTITSIGIGGLNVTEFTQTNDCGSTLVAGATCTIAIQFAPAAIGGKDAALQIFDNAPGSPQIVHLSGTGAVLTNLISVSPQNLSFGAQNIGTSSAPQIVTVKNLVNATLQISPPNRISPLHNPFHTTNMCVTLLPGASCTFSVSFAPTAFDFISPGIIFGTIALVGCPPYPANCDMPQNPASVSLEGTALPANSPFSLSTTNLQFGIQAVGTVSAPQSVTVTNLVNDPLQLSFAFGSGAFPETNTCSSALAPGASCTSTFVFQPYAAGMTYANVFVSLASQFQAGVGSYVNLSGSGGGSNGSSQLLYAGPHAFNVNSDGSLAELATSPLLHGADLYANSKAYSVGIFSGLTALNVSFPSGILTPFQTIPLNLTGSKFVTAVCPGKFLYVVNSTSASTFSIAADGSLGPGPISSVPLSPEGLEPQFVGIATDPACKFLFLTDQFDRIDAFSIDSKTGALTPVPGSPFPTDFSQASIAVDPSGKFLFAPFSSGSSYFSPGNIAVFSINSDGTLASVSGSPFPTGADGGVRAFFPLTVALPSGNFLYVYSAQSTGITGYRIETDGALTEVPGARATLPFFSGSLTSSQGKFLYAWVIIHYPREGIFGFTINADGTLTPLPDAAGAFIPDNYPTMGVDGRGFFAATP